jgi:hypothetical protein
VGRSAPTAARRPSGIVRTGAHDIAPDEQLQGGGQRAGIARADRAVLLAAGDAVGQPVQDEPLEGADALEDVRVQELGIDVEDAPEERVRAEALRALRDEQGQPFALARGARRLRLGLGEDARELPRHQRLQQRRHVGKAPVDRHAAHARAARDVREGGAAHADGQDARAGGVEQRVIRGTL